LWQTPPLILAGEALEREYWIRFDWLKENKNHEKSIDVLKVLIDLWKLGCGRKTPMSTGNNQRTHLINAIIERKPDLTAFTANIKSSEQDNILPPDQSTLGMLIPLLKPFNIVPSGPMPFDSSFPKIPGEGFGSGLQTAETIAEKVGETAAETIAEKMEETVVKQAAQRLVRPLLLPKSLSILGGLALAAATIYVLTRDTSDTGPDASEIELPAAGPLDEEISDPSDSYLIEAPSADSGVPIEAPGAAGKLPAEAPGLRSDPLSLDTWRPEPTLKNAHWGPAPPGGEAGSDYARQVTGSDESVYVTDLHKELKEFQGPKGLGKVEFDGLRNGTLLDAKDWSVGTFFQKGANEILLQAYRQGHALNKSGAKGIEWHCSNVDVAAKIRELFENHGVTIRVIWTPKK